MNALLATIIIATAQNQAGGRIAITDEQGACPDGQAMVIGFAENGDTATGCWLYDSPLMFVKWSDGTLKTYPVEIFTITKAAQDQTK